MTNAGPKRKQLLDLLLIFFFTAVLVRPLFRAKYLQLWSSIESTFIADGRFLAAHWPHPLWQPLWYCGTRLDFISANAFTSDFRCLRECETATSPTMCGSDI